MMWFNAKTDPNLLQKHIDYCCIFCCFVYIYIYIYTYIYIYKARYTSTYKGGFSQEFTGSSLGCAGSHEALHDEVLGQIEGYKWQKKKRERESNWLQVLTLQANKSIKNRH